jgi:hypothetical protein
MSPTSFRFVLFLTSAFLWHSTGFAQPFREISKQTFVVKSDTIVLGDTTAVIQTLEVRQYLMRALAPPNFIYEIRPTVSIVQAAFSNWVGGGVNALAWSSGLNVLLHYRSEPWRWEVRFFGEFGQTLVDGAFRKTNDLLDLTTFVKCNAGLRSRRNFPLRYAHNLPMVLIFLNPMRHKFRLSLTRLTVCKV